MFPHDLDSSNYYLSDNPEKTESDVCSTFRNIWNNNSNKIVIDHLNIDSYLEKIRSFS